MVQHLDLTLQPFAVIGEARRRHHAVIGDRRARIVQLQQQAGRRDGAVFGAHRFGERLEHLLVVFVILVLAVRDDAGGRGHGKKRLRHGDALQRDLDVLYVALQRRFAV